MSLNSLKNLAIGAIGALCAVALLGCQKAQLTTGLSLSSNANHLLQSQAQSLQQSQNLARQIQIVDIAGNPIAGARVLIGTKEGVPFAGNWLTTDQQGLIAAPDAWQNALTVTIDAKGYIRTSYTAVLPQGNILVVRAQTAMQKLQVKGNTSGFGQLSDDGFVHAGLVFPAIARSQILDFQMTSMVSTETDTISAAGQKMDLPSNVTLPKQTVTYYFPITFDKPLYRINVPVAQTYHMVAAHARFPIQEVVDQLREGKSIFDVMNYFEFLGASVSDVLVQNPQTSKDMSVNEISYKASMPVSAPRYSSDLTMLAVGLADRDGYLFPTDVKRVDAGQSLNLTYPQDASNGTILNVLRQSKNNATSGSQVEEMSVVLRAANQSKELEFMPIVAAPAANGQTLRLTPPTGVAQRIQPMGTLLILSQVEEIQSGKMKLETKNTQWEVYTSDWTSQFEIPTLPTSVITAGKHYRWSNTFLGNDGSTTFAASNGLVGGPSPSSLLKATHVTRSAIDL